MRGKRLGYVRGEHGNTGDTLQERACFELFRLQGLNVVWLGPVAHGREPWDWEPGDGLWNGQLSASTPVDELLLFGGGNMGLPGGSARIRAAAARLGLPMTILPNSWRATENLSGQVRYCARERGSIERYCPKAELFPDMALSFDFPEDHGAARPRVPLGVFLRNDREAKFSGDAVPGNQGPPFGKVGKRDVAGYLVLAAAHGVIVTDALHFGIAGLAAGRKVYLVPGAYHKNRSMYDSWLRDLGCLWADSPAAVPELRP
jgi:hypothetical protein